MIRGFLLAMAAALLAGCGTTHATIETSRGEQLMLLGFDPVAYFTDGKPVRGRHTLAATTGGRTYYFASSEHRSEFQRTPAKYEPQYGGFCSNGAAYAVKLGSDPTQFEIRDGRLFIFGDILGHEMWLLDEGGNIRHADELWPSIRDLGWRDASIRAWTNKVPWYKTGRVLMDEWKQKHPGQEIHYDTGGFWNNMVLKYPGWRAREGFGQERLGVPGEPDAAGVEHWAPRNISSPAFESHAAFDPLTGDLYFVRSKPDFSGWRIFVSHCGAEGWSDARPAPFAGDGVEADPFFVDGGRSLYFISTRTTDGTARKDLDIWRVDRAEGRWGTPVRLPEPVNSSAQEWFPRPAADGWLYFGSSRPGGLGRTDIWRAREKDGRWSVENAGPAINTAADEYEAEMSPDGRTLIVMASDGLYESTLGPGGWTRRRKLGPEVNADAGEVGALFSPSGKSLLYARDTRAPQSGEFFVWRREPEPSWPPSCPARMPR